MSTPDKEPQEGGGRDATMSAVFAGMVIQITNMATIFLGKMAHPQTGKTAQDLDHARYFIDQLEMLEVKTKGNLDKQEASLLKQSLTSLRLAFVDAVEHPQPAAPPAAPTTPAAPAVDEQETPLAEPTLPGEGAAEGESRKKFTKKY